MVKSVVLSVSAVIVSVSLMVGQAAAHVVVRPAEVETASFQTFTMGVPNEKDQPVVSVKLVMPSGLQYVSPTQKAGWQINIEKAGGGEEAGVSSVTWNGAEIATGLRDEFSFSAKVPDQTAELQWKAYQTYADGTVVSWDQAEEGHGSHDESSTSGPFSVTKVVTDTQAAVAVQTADKNADDAQKTASLSLYASLVGFATGLTALLLTLRKKK